LKKSFYSSLFIHGLIFVLISITLPEIKTKEVDYISVEIINEGVKEVKEVKEIKVDKKVAIKARPPKQKPIANPKKNETVEIIKKINIKPKPPQKKPEIITPKEKIIKNIDKAIDENNDDFFDDMLKNLAENPPKPITPPPQIDKTNNTQPKKTQAEIRSMQKSLSNTIYKQIRKNYTLPPAPDLKVLNDITVQLRIYVRRDGTITKTVIKNNSLQKAQNDPTYLTYIEAAQRAIRKLGKFDKLPQEEYNSWKIIDIRFTPYET